MISEFELSRILLALILLLSFSLLVGRIFSIFLLPRVVGEILSGIILGPSFFGLISPEMFNWVFNGFPGQAKILSVFYWLGLIFLMFLSGFELPRRIDKSSQKLLICLFIGGIGLPFISGLLISGLIPNHIGSNQLSYALVFGVMAAVTSIPVLSSIFIDLNITSSNFSRLILTSAALQDLVLWVIFSLALSMQSNAITADDFGMVKNELGILINTIIFSVSAIFLAPILINSIKKVLTSNIYHPPLTGLTMLVCLGLVFIASFFGVNVVFSALLAGCVIGQFTGTEIGFVKKNIREFAVWFFVPIYFSLVGLQINFVNNFNLTIFLAILILTSVVKILSVSIFARLTLIPWVRALDYGVAMNARGGPGIVVASIAYSSGVIDGEIFLAFILVSITTSLLAGMWIRFNRQRIINA